MAVSCWTKRCCSCRLKQWLETGEVSLTQSSIWLNPSKPVMLCLVQDLVLVCSMVCHQQQMLAVSSDTLCSPAGHPHTSHFCVPPAGCFLLVQHWCCVEVVPQGQSYQGPAGHIEEQGQANRPCCVSSTCHQGWQCLDQAALRGTAAATMILLVGASVTWHDMPLSAAFTGKFIAAQSHSTGHVAGLSQPVLAQLVDR